MLQELGHVQFAMTCAVPLLFRYKACFVCATNLLGASTAANRSRGQQSRASPTFTVCSHLLKALLPPSRSVSVLQMWGTVLPLDVAKTRIQTAQPGSSWDTGVARQLRMLWREGGRHALWAGLSPTLLRAFPANACQWLAWEVAMRQLLPAAAEGDSKGGSGAGSGGVSDSNRTTRSMQPLPAAAAATAAVAG